MDDLIIIGGSAAGASAAVYAARRNMKFRLIADDLGGEVAQSGEVENWPGTIHTTGIELADKFEAHMRAYDFPLETGVWVEHLEKQGNVFKISAKKDGQPVNYEAKAVILATGVHPRHLEVPGEKEYKNKGVSYCTVCDGPLYRNKRTVTIGGGNSALESAIMLAGLAKEVTLITKNPAMKGEAVLQEKLKSYPNVRLVTNAKTTKIVGGDFVTGVEYSDIVTGETHTIDTEGAFIHVGAIPNSNLIGEVNKNAMGEIVVDRTNATSIPGLFAAGDVTDHPFRQIAIAVGQGVTALLQAARYLDTLTD